MNAVNTIKTRVKQCAKTLHERAVENGAESTVMEKLGYKIFNELQAVMDGKKMATLEKKKSKGIYLERMEAAEGALVNRKSVGVNVKAPSGVNRIGIPTVDEALDSLRGNPTSASRG